MQALLDYCSSQSGMVVVPIEVLSEAGLDPVARTALLERGLLTQFECERIDAMITAYCTRARTLAGASRQWFPPRVQHLCLVRDGVRTRPYFQPFHASSWLLYSDDIAEATSSLEFAIFLLFQAERQYLQQQVGASLLTNLPYLLILNAEQLADFLEGCRRTTRPDAEGYRALAEALPWIRELHHERFNPPVPRRSGDRRLANGLIVTPEQQQRLDTLHRRWMASIESVVVAHRASTGAPSAASGRKLLEWLEAASPHLVLTGERGEVLWSGSGADGDALGRLASRLSPEAERSVLADLAVIDGKSRLFLRSLADPDDLARPAAWMSEGGLSYLHGDTLRIAYSLTDDPGRLWQVSPPYERLMLAARTIHEWGHQAAESGWVRVDPRRIDERRAHEQALVELLDRIVEDLPVSMKPALVAALGPPRASGETPGRRMLRGLLLRIDDYKANRLARHYLTDQEMDTYVRNNVGSRLLAYAPEQALTHLLRVAYEYQYLELSSIRDPIDWFMNSTWFEPLFVAPGILGMEDFHDLTDRIGRICDCYAIDPERISVPRQADRGSTQSMGPLSSSD
ncbi:hypothetical protein HFP89_15440 [Wenzhouxiangella sp. XN79A]|uniref:hypothetical protein n=1 Tax=Wenzhouxiangella sp. XN79A TaxID=2724193 RepID=UPI00144ACAF6|nr:hypothetical protein [Wenzhouxiangella sp. XN79A]NKI36564.1 hypothetical protein [Wenzhouxiangella sp. XN79A]